MPFLDWVNKNEAKQAAAEVPFHLLLHESAHGDGVSCPLGMGGST